MKKSKWRTRYTFEYYGYLRDSDGIRKRHYIETTIGEPFTANWFDKIVRRYENN